jgi:putative transposase
MKSLKSKLSLTFYQKLVLNTLSNEHRLLYNHLLNFSKQDPNFKHLNQEYKNFRKENKLTIQSKPAQNTCRKLINAIKSFYSLKKKDPDAQFPNKFKSWKYFTTLEFDWNNNGGGFDLKDNKVFIHLENAKKVNGKIINSNNIKTLQIKKTNDDYYVIFTYSEPKKELKINGSIISIDPGVTNIATIFNPEKKEIIEIKNNQFHKKLEKRIKTVQSVLDKKKKKSRRWKKLKRIQKRIQKKLTNKNKDFQHKTSKEIANYCEENKVNKVIYGDIKTKKCIKKKKIKGESKVESKKRKGLNKSTQNQGCLSRFKTFVEYKLEDKGMEFVKQNEAWTTQTNCLTGKRFDNKVELSDKKVELTKDFWFSRDGNGAVNIMQKNLRCLEPDKGLWLAQLKEVKTFKMLLDHDEWFKSELRLNFVQPF